MVKSLYKQIIYCVPNQHHKTHVVAVYVSNIVCVQLEKYSTRTMLMWCIFASWEKLKHWRSTKTRLRATVKLVFRSHWSDVKRFIIQITVLVALSGSKAEFQLKFNNNQYVLIIIPLSFKLMWLSISRYMCQNF